MFTKLLLAVVMFVPTFAGSKSQSEGCCGCDCSQCAQSCAACCGDNCSNCCSGGGCSSNCCK